MPRAYSSVRCGHLEQAARQQLARQPLGDIAEAGIGARRHQPRQIGAHRADRRGDGHVVVVEDDDQPVLVGAGIVHGLIGHARAHRAVADHRDHIVVAALEVARHRHADAGRDRGRGMGRAERIIFAFAALGETGKPAALAQGAHARAAAGEDLVGIGLVADVPDDAVVGRLEHVMQRRGQLDHAQPGAEMTAGHRNDVDQVGAQFVGELAQLATCPACAGLRADRPGPAAGSWYWGCSCAKISCLQRRVTPFPCFRRFAVRRRPARFFPAGFRRISALSRNAPSAPGRVRTARWNLPDRPRPAPGARRWLPVP